MNKAILAIPVVGVGRLKLFFANYKALRPHYGILQSLDLASIHSKDSCLVINASVGIDYSMKGDSTVAGVFDLEDATVTITGTFEVDSEFEKFYLMMLYESYGDGGENG